MAAVSCGCGVVITGTRKYRESVVVTAGMFAPPPAETTAARSWIPLRANAFSNIATNLSSGVRIASSSSSRVTRISPVSPSVRVVAALDDSSSLALRHAVRSRLSEPIATVPDGSKEAVLGMLQMTALSSS